MRTIVARALVLVLAVTAPSLAVAQPVSVRAVALNADHYLLGDPLFGAAVRTTLGRAAGRVSLHVGGELVRGSARRMGTLCYGLVPPGRCLVPVPLRDDAYLLTVQTGLGVRVLQWQAFAVAVTAGVHLAEVHVTTHDVASGDKLRAPRTLYGGEVGVEASWHPAPRAPFAIGAGVAARSLQPPRADNCCDGYYPFDQAFHATQFWVGVTWPPRPR